FVMAVASGRVERVAQLVQACLNNGVGIHGIVERYQRACREVYNPKGFTEDDKMLGLLILRLGGARLAGIVHRAKGLPGLTTLRENTIIRPLRASVAMPTIKEIEENIEGCAAGEPESTGPPVILHRVLMLDEIAVEKRLRWDDKTNNILDACRECGPKISLQLNTAADLEVFFASLDRGDIHLASEATVAAFGVFSKDPRMYSARPCCISGTDKTEKGPAHAVFIRQIIAAGQNKRARGNITYRTISIASDGEAKRGAALIEVTMNRDLSPLSPIYLLLSPLQLMNFRVGEDDVTADKDYRHVLKTLRNLLMRLKGVKILGCVITPALLKQHLYSAGHSRAQVQSFLTPNDKQDVDLTYQILKSLWSLEVPPPNSDPGFVRTREALRIFGQLAYHLLFPYVRIDLSLHQQLVHLSAAAHIPFILYSDDEAATSFMANQTYINLMIMIKNAFFCVAKTKIDIPDGEFFLILLGTDRLEVLFGLIRTAIGTDANCDIYQLCTRASHLTETSIILASRPHWDRSPRRLRLPMIINEAGDISKQADHITPAAWKGDVRVQNVTLLTVWVQGRQTAENLIPRGREILTDAHLAGYDIFSPRGNCLVNYLDEESPAEFEFDPDCQPSEPDMFPDSPTAPTADSSTESASYNSDGDIEDALATTGPEGKFSAHVEINGKLIPKARALSALMRYRGTRSSTDRLKRVAGLPSFNLSMDGSGILSDGALGAASLRVGNPVALVVSCEDRLFLAVGQALNLSLSSSSVFSIPLDMLVDSSAKVSVQILRISRATIADDPTEKHDWHWTQKFEETCMNVAGNLIHPMNPEVSVLQAGKPTYLFDSGTLITAAATIHDQMRPTDLMHVPKVKRTDNFPYRNQGISGRACFLLEHDGTDRLESGNDPTVCSKCSPVVQLDSNGQRILEHMGCHILFDPAFSSELQQPCGACLRPYPLCSLHFKPRRGTTAQRQVDWSRSTCGNPFNFNMAYASVSKDADSPCSNVPVQCALCEDHSPLVWTYNLAAHWRTTHNRTAGPFTYLSANKTPIPYTTSDNEVRWMKKKWGARFTKSKSTKRPPLAISAEHTSAMVLRLVFLFFGCSRTLFGGTQGRCRRKCDVQHPLGH
ncbi:hypothetical protein C8R45DRAFT_844729, partial [Mycena sanguinolenta]